MKLRLNVKDNDSVTRVEIHGELMAEGLHELDRVCNTPGELVIDLENLRHLDSVAAARLRELSMRARLVGASGFIKILIEGGPSSTKISE